MADSDEQVAATVAEWERIGGLPVRDWPAIGRAERESVQMSRCDRCSREFERPGIFTVWPADERHPQWAALFCSEECRDSFVEKYRERPDIALEVLSLHVTRGR